MQQSASNNGSVDESSEPRDWPGDRHPTRWDVHDANKLPETRFLQRFKTALLHSEDALNCKQLMTQLGHENDDPSLLTSHFGEAADSASSGRQYTYPMTLFSDLPSVPPEDQRVRLHFSFFSSFKQHVYLETLSLPDSLGDYPPHLHFALACLASAVSQQPIQGPVLFPHCAISTSDISSSLFQIGTKLWGVIIEADNREARLLESVLSVGLLSVYGLLTADQYLRSLAATTLNYGITILRRLHLHDWYSPLYLGVESVNHNISKNSSLVGFIFLVDVISAMVFDRAPNLYAREMFLDMPTAGYSFQKAYHSLMTGSALLPAGVQTREDALFLLTAILSDIIYIHRFYDIPEFSSPDASGLARPAQWRHMRSRIPFITLSGPAELARLGAVMRSALDRWYRHFNQAAKRDILSLFFFCKLCLICPCIYLLPDLVNKLMTVRDFAEDVEHFTRVEISDEALNYAWLVLDSINIRKTPPENSQSAWIPTVLFYSGLVVWQRLRRRTAADFKYGTLKVLEMFKKELEQLPWDCCREMTYTLDCLMKSQR